MLPKLARWLFVASLGATVVVACVAEDRRGETGARSQGLAVEAKLNLNLLTPSAVPDTALTYVGSKLVLPKWKTSWERNIERLYRNASSAGLSFADTYSNYRQNNIAKFFITQPPTAAVRAVAEFEPSQAYLVQWVNYGTNYNNLIAQMVKGGWGIVPALMVYHDAAHKTFIEGELTKVGIAAADFTDTSKIIWWNYKVDWSSSSSTNYSSIWARDFGPLGVVEAAPAGAPKLSFIDFRYYYTRIYDDEIPTGLAQSWGINVFRPDMDFEGGNFMNTSDGLCGTSKGALWFNPQLSLSAIEDTFETYLGCKKVVMPTPVKGEGTTHIDMFSKFGSDTAVLVGEYTAVQDSANKTILDANAALFASTTNGSGNPLVVTRIPMPNKGGTTNNPIWRTYTNSLALAKGTQKALLIPVYSDETTYETQAMAAYSTVFPGWTQVKLDSKVIIPAGGAMHCITMQIPEGAKAKMEADPAPLCGADKWECAYTGCGNIKVQGCCDGEILKYCDNSKLYAIDCSSNPSCGWDSSQSWYDCGTGGADDPAGTYVKYCGVLTDAALPDIGPDTTYVGCGNITTTGCCDGDTLKYCMDNTVYSESCAGNPSCGWDASQSWYDCGTAGGSDPSGANVKNCGVLTDAAVVSQCGDVTDEGCCDGQTVWYCDNGTLNHINCSSNPSCGWSASYSWYDCGTSGTADPSGTYPMSCSAMFGDAGPPKTDGGATPDGGPVGCGDISEEGCCDGETLKYCDGGKLETLDCTQNPSCGWSASLGWYDCGTSGGADPSGTHPKACSGGKQDGGTLDQQVEPDLSPVTPDLTPPTPDLPPPALDQMVQLDIDVSPDATVEQPKDDDGCSCAVAAEPSGKAPLFLLLGLLALALRRRR